MARITVDLRELGALRRRLTTVVEVAAMTRMRQDVAAETLRQTQQRFSQRRAPDGEPWRERVDNKPHPLLEQTGRMRRSIRAVPDRDGVAVSSSMPYAAVHQFGSETVPARPFLGFGEGDLTDLAGIAGDRMARFFGEPL